MGLVESLITAIVPSLLVGIVLFYWEQKKKRNDKKVSEQETLLIEGDMLRLDLEVATAQLSYAVAMAYKRGKPNGEMESAIESYEKAMDKFRKYERKQFARNNRE